MQVRDRVHTESIGKWMDWALVLWGATTPAHKATFRPPGSQSNYSDSDEFFYAYYPRSRPLRFWNQSAILISTDASNNPGGNKGNGNGTSTAGSGDGLHPIQRHTRLNTFFFIMGLAFTTFLGTLAIHRVYSLGRRLWLRRGFKPLAEANENASASDTELNVLHVES